MNILTIILLSILAASFLTGSITVIYKQIKKHCFDNIPGTVVMILMTILLVISLISGF